MNKENLRAIEALRRKYASDEDAMAVIEKSAKDVEYIEKREVGDKHTGQSSRQFIL